MPAVPVQHIVSAGKSCLITPKVGRHLAPSMGHMRIPVRLTRASKKGEKEINFTAPTALQKGADTGSAGPGAWG